MKVDANKVVALRARIAAVEVEAARREERREAAIKGIAEAEAKLVEQGFDPATAAEALDALYQELLEEVCEMEEAVGISCPAS